VVAMYNKSGGLFDKIGGIFKKVGQTAIGAVGGAIKSTITGGSPLAGAIKGGASSLFGAKSKKTQQITQTATNIVYGKQAPTLTTIETPLPTKGLTSYLPIILIGVVIIFFVLKK